MAIARPERHRKSGVSQAHKKPSFPRLRAGRLARRPFSLTNVVAGAGPGGRRHLGRNSAPLELVAILCSGHVQRHGVFRETISSHGAFR
jgi:hypothetical protein